MPWQAPGQPPRGVQIGLDHAEQEAGLGLGRIKALGGLEVGQGWSELSLDGEDAAEFGPQPRLVGGGKQPGRKTALEGRSGLLQPALLPEDDAQGVQGGAVRGRLGHPRLEDLQSIGGAAGGGEGAGSPGSRLGVARVERQHPFVPLQRFAGSAGSFEEQGELVVGLLVVGRQIGGRGQVADRFQRTTEAGVELGQCEVGRSRGGIECQEFFVGCLGLVELAGVDARQSQVLARLQVRGVGFDGAAEERCRGGELAAWTAIRPCWTRAVLPVGR